MSTRLICLFCLALLLGCREEELEGLDFFEVSIQPPEPGQRLGTLYLSGDIIRAGDTRFDDHGFYWSEDLGPLQSDPESTRPLSLGPRSGEGVFSDSLTGLGLNRSYFFRAYARAGERIVFSDTITPFAFEFQLEAFDAVEVYNNQARLSGLVLGLQNLRATVEQHGHIISTTNSLPEFNPDSAFLAGPRGVDGLFSSTFSGLQYNTLYYAWAFAKTADTAYFSPPIEFCTGDGWRPVQELPEELMFVLAEGVGDKGYLLYGCTEFSECSSGGQRNTTLWEFTPPAGDGQGNWAEISALPNYIPACFGAVSFVIGQNIFFGFGNDGISLVNELFHVNPLQPNDWHVVILPPAAPRPRMGAIAFASNGLAYIGSGIGYAHSPPLSDSLLNDFWEFDPTANNFRQVAGLSIRKPSSTTDTYKGRRFASAFTARGRCFAGGGDTFGPVLNDFWEFHPPASAQDTGHWEFHSFFPGTARTYAVAFTINDIAYYGAGLSNADGSLSDMWAFDPNREGQAAWKEVTSFQGVARFRAAAFVAGGKGYVGTGDKIVFDGPTTAAKSTRDIWEYHPKELDCN